MTKRHFLFITLGIFFAVFIIPGMFMWLGYPAPSQGIANMFTAILGESSIANGLIAFSVVAVLILLLIVGASKITNRMEKSS